MRMEIKRHSIQIVPESELDVAYLEEVLGMKNDTALPRPEVKRVNVASTYALAYAEIARGK